MTYLSELEPLSSARSTERLLLASLIARLASVVDFFSAWLAEEKALRLLETMPADLRKDIGWPASDNGVSATHRGMKKP